ncbi:MAG: indolepyruvate oxidoreductase subunit beta [Planctomycetota bacterium]
MPDVTNIVIAGIGGQGVLKASDILAGAAFQSGYDVKKSELHGMSQRGGSVSSDVRFGDEVYSPMVPPGEAHVLVVLAEDQVEVNEHRLASGGTLLTPELIDEDELPRKKTLNVALLGVLSTMLDIDEDVWMDEIEEQLPPRFHEANRKAFQMGREARCPTATHQGEHDH